MSAPRVNRAANPVDIAPREAGTMLAAFPWQLPDIGGDSCRVERGQSLTVRQKGNKASTILQPTRYGPYLS